MIAGVVLTASGVRRPGGVTGHATIKNDVADVAVIGEAAEAAVSKEAVEASIERPIRVLVIDVIKIQELPCEGINVVVSHQRPIAAARDHVATLGDGIDGPARSHGGDESDSRMG